MRGVGSFQQLRAEGVRRHSGPVGITYVGGAELDGPAVAFAIGRRVGPAVRRNRLRRQLRSILESEARRGALAPGRYLVSLGPSASTMSYDQLTSAVRDVLTRLGAAR